MVTYSYVLRKAYFSIGSFWGCFDSYGNVSSSWFCWVVHGLCNHQTRPWQYVAQSTSFLAFQPQHKPQCRYCISLRFTADGRPYLVITSTEGKAQHDAERNYWGISWYLGSWIMYWMFHLIFFVLPAISVVCFVAMINGYLWIFSGWLALILIILQSW